MADWDPIYTNRTYAVNMYFQTASGERKFTYKHVRKDITHGEVKTAMDAIVDHADLFETPPLSKLSAELVLTEITPIFVPNDDGN